MTMEPSQITSELQEAIARAVRTAIEHYRERDAREINELRKRSDEAEKRAEKAEAKIRAAISASRFIESGDQLVNRMLAALR